MDYKGQTIRNLGGLCTFFSKRSVDNTDYFKPVNTKNIFHIVKLLFKVIDPSL